MSNADILVKGDDYLGLGIDQFISPQKVGDGKYVNSENTMCRGGVVQTRPGSQTLFKLPDGVLQGMTMFKPSSGIAHLVFAVSGLIYVSQYPFKVYRQLSGLQFGVSSQNIAWASCLKTTDYDSAGKLFFLDNPYSVLIMQDGRTRAAYWDGATQGHMNPTPSPIIDPDSGQRVTAVGYDGTPIGLWMSWANNRLWVSRGNQIFASDQGNPTKFTEDQYINEGRAFYLPDNCTGITTTTDQQGIICFTDQTGTFIQSSIQDRKLWTSTPNFTQVVLPSVGCVAPRSIVSQHGQLWWYSSRGLITQDDALRANITSRLNVQDNAMYGTKANMSFNLRGICSVAYENMILVSVPFGDKLNRRTMALDQAPLGEVGQQINAWASYWTGWRPVEWAFGIIDGDERCFFASVDYDGNNRIWEIGVHGKRDNGVSITSNLVTKEFLFDSRDYKILSYIEAELLNIEGDVSFMMSAAGVRGGWQVLGRKEIVSSQGQIYGDSKYGYGANKIAGTSSQTRNLLSQNYHKSNECNSLCIESDRSGGLIDKAFSVMFTWSGVAGILAYRVFCRPDTNFYSGNCEKDEAGIRLLNDSGCGSYSRFSNTTPFDAFTSTKHYEQLDQETGLIVGYDYTATSIISQVDADRKAYDSAKAYVEEQIS